MDNEEIVDDNSNNNSTSDLAEEAPSSEESNEGNNNGNNNTYDGKNDRLNNAARRMDNLANNVRNKSDSLKKAGAGLNKYAEKHADSKLGKVAGAAGNASTKAGDTLGDAADKLEDINDSVQDINNKANAVKDPLGSAKDAATEKAKNATKKVVKKATVTIITSLLPILLATIAIIFLVVIVVSIFMVLVGAASSTEDSTAAAGGNGSCSYNVNGQVVTDLKVRLLNCEGNTTLAGEELIDFEDYITGVVYQEVGDAPLEALKVQAIVARSFSLTRPKMMNGAYGLSLKQENGQWILALRSCTNDQVFCNPDKGCWSLRTGGQTSDSNPSDWPNCTVHSGNDTSKPWHRGPLSADSNIRKAVEETKGQVLEDSKGNIVHTNFNNTNQQKWASLAKSGKDAFEILTKDYGSGKRISNANCSSDDSIDSSISSADVATITKWNQSEAWKNLIGKSTSESKPHVSESEMNKRVTTISVTVRKWNSGSGHNPRTDTHKSTASITINKALAPLWKAFFDDLYNNAPDFVIASMDGCYVYRSVTGGGSLSAHAYGVACDINAGTPGNGYGTTSYTKSKWQSLPETRAKYQVVYRGSKVAQIAHKYTLINGSDWSGGGNDAMHFSFIRDWDRSRLIACQGKVSCS